MNIKSLHAENSRLRREIAQLRNELKELRAKQQESKITEPAAPAQKQFNPMDPVPGDVVFNMLRQRHQTRRRRWLE